MQVVPLSSLANQTVSIVLGNQNCQINVRTLTTGTFFDLFVDGVAICQGVLCHDQDLLVRAAYTGFVGEFSFVDTQGIDDPVWTGFGSRFQLIYLEASDLG